MMNKILVYGTVVCTTLLFFTSTYAGSMEDSKPITPEKAILSRHNATIFVKEKVLVNKGKFSVVLPSSFVPESFVIETQDMNVKSTEVSLSPIYIKNIPLVQSRIDALKKIEQLGVKIQALDARIKVLSSSQQVFTSAKDISSLDSALGSRFEYLYNQRNSLRQQQDDVRKELKTIENALIQATGSVEPSYIVLNISLVNGSAEGSFDVKYAYVVNNAGWNPTYQVDADISKKNVSVQFMAEMWQRTGISWNGTNVIISTATPSMNPEPVYLPQWNISAHKPEAKMMMARSGIQTLELTGADAPAVESISNAMQWALGKQNLLAGETRVITISNSLFDADFLYTLRPYVSNEAVLTARLKTNGQTTLSGGRANFSVATLGVGQGYFTFIPQDKNTVYFGKDPLVTGTMQTQKEELIVNKKEQVKTFLWKIQVQNMRKNAVTVLVQDVKPQTTSPQIAISFDGTSLQPKVEDSFMEWEIVGLKSNKMESILYGVTLTAPLDIEILSPR